MKLFPFLKGKSNKAVYKCPCCGKLYDELPLCFGAEFPEYYFSIPTGERNERIEMKESLCVVDETHFFHRGRITIPITDFSEDLIFNVWASISEENFNRRMNLWNDPKRVEEKPYFGWLQTYVPTYGETLDIRSIAVEREAGLIPEIKIIEEGHALKIDQENGIIYKKALKIISQILSSLHKKN